MSAKRRTTALVNGVFRYSAMACARAGLEFPATSLIAPFLPDIVKSPHLLGWRRGGHNKAGRGGQYDSKSLSRSISGSVNAFFVSAPGGRQRQRFGRGNGRDGVRTARRQRDRAFERRRCFGGRLARSAVAFHRIGFGLEDAEDAGRLGRGISAAEGRNNGGPFLWLRGRNRRRRQEGR